MIRYVIRPALIAALAIAWSCSKDEPQKNTFEVKAVFSFTQTDVWPERYKIILGAFGTDTVNPLVFSGIPRQQEGVAANFFLENIPEDAATIRVCVTNQSDRTVYTLFRYDVAGVSGVTDIPENEIRLLSFGRVQAQVLNNCTACHGGASGLPAAGLNLMPGHSYAGLVNQDAVNSAKKLVEPGNAGNSFLTDVLRKRQTTFDHSASNTVPEEDIVLTELWIEAGAVNN